MVVFPNCKINIGLHITERRPDGFHNIETVFYPVPWTDILEIIPSVHEEFIFKGNSIDCEIKDNLCYKAYRLLKSDFNIPPIKLFLYKNIPSGAGLGGGSADAAFTLATLNKLYSLGLNEETLLGYASRLGSDCAFFIRNQPVFAAGRGDQFSEISLNLAGWYLLIVKPALHISTADAYRMVNSKIPQNGLQKLIQLPIGDWKQNISNDFEASLFAGYPELNHIKQTLYSLGAVYAAMSGSGSAIYGLFADKIDNSKEFAGMVCCMKQLQ